MREQMSAWPPRLHARNNAKNDYRALGFRCTISAVNRVVARVYRETYDRLESFGCSAATLSKAFRYLSPHLIKIKVKMQMAERALGSGCLLVRWLCQHLLQAPS